MMTHIKTSLILLCMISLLTGIAYPVMITVIAQIFFPWQANGSLVEYNHQPVGSLLIGQTFTSDGYFWGRPSATSPFPYNALNSGGSNAGPLNPDYIKTVKERIAHVHKNNNGNTAPIPADLVMASGSGLDPEISPRAAYYQVSRIAKARNIPAQEIEKMIARLVQNRTLGILGKPRINVLQLNLALMEGSKVHAKTP